MTSDEFANRITALTPTMYRVCVTQLSSHTDREDAVQEALAKAWDKRKSLRDESFFETWLIRILLNECHNLQKRRKRYAPMEFMPESADAREGDSGLRDALISLEAKLRAPILLYYIEGYNVKEVSAMLGVREGTIKTRLARGRMKLKEMLSEGVFDA